MVLFMKEDEYECINEECLNRLKKEIIKESEEHYSKGCESFKVSSVRILSIQRISEDYYKNKIWEYEKF